MSMHGTGFDVVTWGEGFLRLTPRGRERFEQAGGFDVTVAGGALETAVGLARLGLRTAWMSVVGDTPLGMKLVNKVREHGVDTERVVRLPDGRTGLCYAETGSAPRPARSWYDMDDTAFRSARPGVEHWPNGGETDVLHLDLTTPMLDAVNAGRLEFALESARAANNRVSVLLDTPEGGRLEAEVEKRVRDLVETAGYLMMTRRALETVWGFEGPLASAADLARTRFGAKHTAVVELQFPPAGDGAWHGIAISPSGEACEDRVDGIRVVDSEGAPGAFAAGFLLGLQEDCTRTALRYGAAAAALTCSVPGPMNWFTREDLESQIEGTGSGLQR